MKTYPVIKLRAVEPEDLDILYGIENNKQLWSVGVTSVPYSRYILHDYIANNKNDIYTDGQVRFMIENESGEVVGTVDLTNFDPKNNKAEMGIVIITHYRHKGYATATISQIADYALSVLHLHQVYVVIAESNKIAIDMFGKAGYQKTAILQEWLYNGKKYENAVILQTFL